MGAFQFVPLIGILMLVFMLLIGGVYYLIKRPNQPFFKVIFSGWVMGAAIALSLVSIPGQLLIAQPSQPYPEEAVQSFTNSCVENGIQAGKPELVQQICTCAIEEFQKQYTYDEFLENEKAIAATGKMPNGIRETIVGCTLSTVPAKQ